MPCHYRQVWSSYIPTYSPISCNVGHFYVGSNKFPRYLLVGKLPFGSSPTKSCLLVPSPAARLSS